MSTRKEKISGYNIYCKILPIPLLVSIFRSNPSGTSVLLSEAMLRGEKTIGAQQILTSKYWEKAG